MRVYPQIIVPGQWRCNVADRPQAALLLGIEGRGLHLLRVVVCTIRCWSHHAAHAGHCVAGLRVGVCRWCVGQLVGVHVECHAVLLDSDHVWRACSSWRGRGNSRYGCRHSVGLLRARHKHGYHATRCHVRLLRGTRWVVVASWHELLRLESGLEGLEGRRMDSTFWDVIQRCTCGNLARIRRLTGMLVEAWLLA